MASRWLSTFSVLGIILLVLGLIGLVRPHFIYDPGQVQDGNEHWYYLAAGVLMLANGLLSPAPVKMNKAKDVPAPRRVPATSNADNAEQPRL